MAQGSDELLTRLDAFMASERHDAVGLRGSRASSRDHASEALRWDKEGASLS